MLTKLAAEKAKNAAEEYFKLQNIDAAIKSAEAAKYFNPLIPGIEEFIAACSVHKAMSTKRCWYQVLGVEDPFEHPANIYLHYEKLAALLHPCTNGSVAADGAYKLVNSSWDVLSDPKKRSAYNYHMGYYHSSDDPFSGLKMDFIASTSSASAERCSSMHVQGLLSTGKGKQVLVNN